MIAGVLGVEEAGHVRTTERLGFFGRGAVVGRCCESQTRGPAVQLAVQTQPRPVKMRIAARLQVRIDDADPRF
jgi:hypothetical protein